ncbi:MAG: hypothetical protein WC214_04080 [Candidatus Omnitrophota bacterium]|nr:hypothetical protein [Candidatus Omnitrophota bacterium]
MSFIWRKSIFFVAVILSVVIHVFICKLFFLETSVKRVPVIYTWLNILSGADIMPGSAKNKNILPTQLITTQTVMENFRVSSVENFNIRKEDQTGSLNINPSSNSGYVFLWDKNVLFTVSENKEIIPFKVYVSPLGKVIFLYPQKLPANSSGGIVTANYLRSSVLFQNDIFFWTKICGVVE